MQQSIWEQQSFYSRKHVIIVGAGLAGLWTALELYNNDKNLNILLLDRGIIPTGASTRNAGFACFGSPTELLHDAATLGEDKMWEIVEMRFRGIEKIRRHFADNVIDYDQCGGYELLSGDYNVDNLDDQLNALNRGLQSITNDKVTFERVKNKLNSFKFNGFCNLIENKYEGGLHSGKLVQVLMKKVLSLGVELITSIEVTNWQNTQNGIEIYTNRGIKFKCDKLLICNNGLASTLTKNVAVKPGRGQIIVTSPIDNLPFRGTFHFDGGFYYFRNIGNRVLLGGARNKAFDEETTNNLETTRVIQNELERFLRENILPGVNFTIEYRWSGIMGFTETGLPLTQEIEPDVFAMITCNGMGVALSPIIAEKMAKIMTM